MKLANHNHSILHGYNYNWSIHNLLRISCKIIIIGASIVSIVISTFRRARWTILPCRFYRPRFVVRQWQRQQRVVGDKQRQWNDKRNDKQERVNKGPACAEKRTSARQARVARTTSNPARLEGDGGRKGEGGWRHTRIATRGVTSCVRDDRQRYRIHSGHDIAARFANFHRQAARASLPFASHRALHAFRSLR